MNLVLLAGTANPPLAERIAADLGHPLAEREASRFPDGELHIEIRSSVRGADVYIVQPTSPPPEAHLFELLLLVDACRRAGAARVTAVIPYLGYARQDRRATGREPVGARVVADLLNGGGLQRVVAVDLHSPSLEGLFAVPVEHLSGVSQLASALRDGPLEGSVVVAPDLGAAKIAERYARHLGLPVALVHKRRVSGLDVAVRGLTGDVCDRLPLIVDDMITTGGTVAAAARAVIEAGARPEVTVAATHGLLVTGAHERLGALPIRRLLTTDSVDGRPVSGLKVDRVTLAPLLAEAIRRLHQDRSLSDLLLHA